MMNGDEMLETACSYGARHEESLFFLLLLF